MMTTDRERVNLLLDELIVTREQRAHAEQQLWDVYINGTHAGSTHAADAGQAAVEVSANLTDRQLEDTTQVTLNR